MPKKRRKKIPPLLPIEREGIAARQVKAQKIGRIASKADAKRKRTRGKRGGIKYRPLDWSQSAERKELRETSAAIADLLETTDRQLSPAERAYLQSRRLRRESRKLLKRDSAPIELESFTIDLDSI